MKTLHPMATQARKTSFWLNYNTFFSLPLSPLGSLSDVYKQVIYLLIHEKKKHDYVCTHLFATCTHALPWPFIKQAPSKHFLGHMSNHSPRFCPSLACLKNNTTEVLAFALDLYEGHQKHSKDPQ